MDEDKCKSFAEYGPINAKLRNFWKILDNNRKNVVFSDHDNNVATIKRFYKWLKRFNQIPDMKSIRKKNNHKSNELRLEGNIEFKTGRNLSRALELYNESICWAEYGEELAIGFASRSAIYFEWEKYDICLENINLAIITGCPDRLLEILNERKLLCIQLQKYLNDNATNEQIEKLDENKTELFSFDITSKRDIPTLSLKSNSNVPFIVDCLTVEVGSLQGRHVVTENDLFPGQIIAIEESYVNALTKPYCYRKCANCFKENYMNLIPCETCTCTMFCSEKCLTEAQRIHKFECPVLQYIWEQCPEFALPLRLVIKAFITFKSVDELIEFRKEKKSPNLELTACLNDKERYSQVSNLLTNEEKRCYSDMFLLSCKVAILYHFLIEKTEFSEILKTEIQRDTLISLILQHSQISSINSMNCHEIQQLDLQHFLDNDSQCVFAKGIYPFSSLFNHSCLPNTSTLSIGTKLVTYVTRPIKRNSQVYGCYHGMHLLNHNKGYRQEYLKSLFHFTCYCEACTNYYPSHSEHIMDEFASKEKLYQTIQTIDLHTDIDNIETFCSLLQCYDFEHPCPNLTRIFLRLKRAIAFKFGELSTDVTISLNENIEEINLLKLSHAVQTDKC